LALPRLLLFFYALFLKITRDIAIRANLLPEDDAQTAAPVLRQGNTRDFYFRG